MTGRNFFFEKVAIKSVSQTKDLYSRATIYKSLVRLALQGRIRGGGGGRTRRSPPKIGKNKIFLA